MTANSKLFLQPVTLDDAEILFKWRNDPLTRQYSHNQEEISYDDHCNWLRKSLQDKNRKIYIAIFDGKLVGTLRADYTDKDTELSWTVNPEFRGQGFGKQMVKLLAESITCPLRAEVKTSNLASQKIAENCGMSLEKTENDILYYYRGIKIMETCPLCDNETHFVFTINKFIYHRCDFCHALFVANPPNIEEIHNGYSESYFESFLDNSNVQKERRGYFSYMQAQESLKNSFNRKLNVVLQHSDGGKLLEIGAAYGTFMMLAKDNFDCTGLEVSQYAVQVARNKFGIDMHQGSIEENIGFPDNSFDVVVMWDVIEHLANPYKSLVEVHRVLKPGGSVFISTDDVSNWLPKVLGKKWWGLAAPLHLCHFSKKGMGCLLNRSGEYEKIMYFKDWRKYSIGEIISHFGVSYKNKFLINLGKRILNSSFGRIDITVARPEQFISYAKKSTNE